MTSDAPYGGRRLIADSSVWSALHRAQLLRIEVVDWTEALERDQILTSPIVRLEILHSARNDRELEEWDERLSIMHEIPLTHTACLAAVSALRELAGKSAGYHRVGLGDALIAASAQDVNPAVGVLHYNHGDFQKLAEVLAFDQVALAPPGTFEPVGV